MAFDIRHILSKKSARSRGYRMFGHETHDLQGKGVLAGICLMLAGCINATPLDNLDYAKPTGSAFNIALYHDYGYLAHSFGHVGTSAHKVFDFKGSISLNETQNDIAMLANTYATKAVEAADGNFIDPEVATDVEGHEARDHLLRVLEDARDWFPRDAALAQANFDCWQLNSQIKTQEKAAAHCKASFVRVLNQVETETDAQRATIKAKQDAAKAAQAAARKQAIEEEKKARQDAQ